MALNFYELIPTVFFPLANLIPAAMHINVISVSRLEHRVANAVWASAQAPGFSPAAAP